MKAATAQSMAWPTRITYGAISEVPPSALDRSTRFAIGSGTRCRTSRSTVSSWLPRSWVCAASDDQVTAKNAMIAPTIVRTTAAEASQRVHPRRSSQLTIGNNPAAMMSAISTSRTSHASDVQNQTSATAAITLSSVGQGMWRERRRLTGSGIASPG
jgi:hypothetical protein